MDIVGTPWTEGGRICLQLRLPQKDGSNLEPIVRLPFEELAEKSDDEVAALVSEAVAELTEPPEPAVPSALLRVVADPKTLDRLLSVSGQGALTPTLSQRERGLTL